MSAADIFKIITFGIEIYKDLKDLFDKSRK
jgi:hypothetical protein